MKLEKVVVAVDFSPPSLAATRWSAAHLAPDAEIALVHCLELPAAASMLWEALPPKGELAPRLHRSAEERLEVRTVERGDGSRG